MSTASHNDDLSAGDPPADATAEARSGAAPSTAVCSASPASNAPILVAALYKFAHLPDYAALRGPWAARACAAGVTGSLLLAEEGVNGTIAGAPEALRGFLAFLRADPRLADLEHKESWASAPPFRRLKVRLKREIVSMGAPGVVREDTVGAYVAPADWNALISRPDVAVIDTRNDYEIAIGRFQGAIDPGTAGFRDFPAWAERALAPGGALEAARDGDIEVAMYCTGGIRCEKATALMRALGVKAVHHLKGGILKYLEEVPAKESLWRGDCFVFDERVSVGHGLREGDHTLCYGCRRAVTAEDMASPLYRKGVCCPACAADMTPEQERSRVERQRQIALAAGRGESHLR